MPRPQVIAYRDQLLIVSLRKPYLATCAHGYKTTVKPRNIFQLVFLIGNKLNWYLQLLTVIGVLLYVLVFLPSFYVA